jgi:hypothetical protein
VAGGFIVCATGGDVGCGERAEGVRPDGGGPFTLGLTQGEGAPSVVPVEEGTQGGFLVAYAGVSGIAMHFVPQFEPPFRGAGTLDVERARVPFRFLEGHQVEEVAVAVSNAPAASDGTFLTVEVVWREGCGGGARLGFGRVRFNRSRPESSTVITESAQSLASGDVSAPRIAYVPSAFIEPVEFRKHNGNTPTPGFESSTGGWAVTWVQRSGATPRVVGRRVLERDGRLIDEDAIEVESTSRGSVYHAVHGLSGGETFLAAVTHPSASGGLSVRGLCYRRP